MDVLGEFDRQVEMQRQWLIEELRLEDKWRPQDLVDEWYPPQLPKGQ
jgi:hypothetical protein